MSNIVVIYHGGCWDGFCAAWLLWRKFPDAEFIPAQYGDRPPDVSGKHVYIVDFSYQRDVLVNMYSDSASLIVLDHHKTAEADLKDLPFAKFDNSKSGARLTHEYLYGSGLVNPVNWLVHYTEDRDLWNWELVDSKAINAALRSYPLDFELWEKFSQYGNDELDILAAEGEAILRVEASTVAAKVEQAHIVEVPMPMDDLTVSYDASQWWSKWKVTNATTLMSETAGALAEETGVGCCWFEFPSGERLYSLRALKDSNVDVSIMAKAFGGGGHKKAAGFKAAQHPWKA